MVGDSRTELQLLLEDEGFSVLRGVDARTGLRLAEAHGPDLIIQDPLFCPTVLGDGVIRVPRPRVSQHLGPWPLRSVAPIVFDESGLRGVWPMSTLIHVRHGGIVGVAQGPAIEGERPTTALHVHGHQLPSESADAEVHLASEELVKLVSELVERMTASDRRDLAARLGAD
jgi:hypothetical protein